MNKDDVESMKIDDVESMKIDDVESMKIDDVESMKIDDVSEERDSDIKFWDLSFPASQDESNLDINYLENLPQEILEKIMLKLNYYEIEEICHISPRIQEIIGNNNYFWELKIKQNFPDYNPDAIHYCQVSTQSGFSLSHIYEKWLSERDMDDALKKDDAEYIEYVLRHNIFSLDIIIEKIRLTIRLRSYRRIIKTLLSRLHEKHYHIITSFVLNVGFYLDINLIREIYQKYPHRIKYDLLYMNFVPWAYNHHERLINPMPSDGTLDQMPYVILILLFQMGNPQDYVTLFYREIDNYNIKEILFLIPIFRKVNLSIDPNVLLYCGIKFHRLLYPGIMFNNYALINVSLNYGATQFIKTLRKVRPNNPPLVEYVHVINSFYKNRHNPDWTHWIQLVSRKLWYLAQAFYIIGEKYNAPLQVEITYIYWGLIIYRENNPFPRSILKILKETDGILPRVLSYIGNYPNLKTKIIEFDSFLQKV